MSDDKEKVLIETSIEHAQALSKLLDLSVRIHLGQFEELADLARMGEIRRRSGTQSTDGEILSIEQIEQIEEWLKAIKWVLGHPGNGSFGIGAPGVAMDAKRGYEIKKALDKALHMHLTPDVLHSVHRDGVLVRYAPGEVPEARIEIKR